MPYTIVRVPHPSRARHLRLAVLLSVFLLWPFLSAGVPAHAQSAESTETGENAKPKRPPRLTLAQIQDVLSGDDRKRRKNAVAQLRTMANKGDTLAQTYLADLYFQGRGVVHNYPLAAYWYEVAAKRGNTDAQFKLAGMYRDNIGVVQTGGAVRDWLMKAAEGGHGEARRLLLSQGLTPPPLKPITPITVTKKKSKDDTDAAATD